MPAFIQVVIVFFVQMDLVERQTEELTLFSEILSMAERVT